MVNDDNAGGDARHGGMPRLLSRLTSPEVLYGVAATLISALIMHFVGKLNAASIAVIVSAAMLVISVILLAHVRRDGGGLVFGTAAGLTAISAMVATVAVGWLFRVPTWGGGKSPGEAPAVTVTATLTPPPFMKLNDNFSVGECVLAPQVHQQDEPVPDRLPTVSCLANHDAEVYFVGDIWSPGQRYPGERAVDERTDHWCDGTFKKYVHTSTRDSIFDYDYWYPDRDEWVKGDRRIICIAYLPGKSINYSVKDLRR